MATLSLPLSHTPPYALLALGLLKKVNIEWKEGSSDVEPSFGDVKGNEEVRKALEEGLPGKEVSLLDGTLMLELNSQLIYTDPSPYAADPLRLHYWIQGGPGCLGCSR